MRAKSISGNSPSAIKLALQQSMADGFSPTLAVLFISIGARRWQDFIPMVNLAGPSMANMNFIPPPAAGWP